MKTNLISTLLFAALSGILAAAPPVLPNPDFTKGETIPKEATKDWNLGATGARGWIYTNKGSTVQARQVYITNVAAGSPGEKLLVVGDVLLGVSGKAFSYDPRTELGKALTVAEAKDGKLTLTRWRAGSSEEIVIQLPVLGSYSATAPYECEKSKRILSQSCEALAKRIADPSYKENAISRSLNALGLLASGDPKYLPLIKKEAEWAAGYAEGGYQAWWYGYVTVFLSEYVLATGDQSVLPGLRRIAMEASVGQSRVGSWGHRFAGPDGRLFGYGMMNSPGVVLTIGLVLAREAGVKDPEVATAIERSGNLLRFYIGKGAVPYGDHAPFMACHEDNGKCGMGAVLFDQLGEKDGAEFFAKMSTASHGNERDQGHTGNFFNMTWAMPGVSRCGPQATGAWMEEFGSWYFDLARQWDGNFPHQGPAQSKDDSYAKWDATGVYLIAYAMPLKKIRLTGSKSSKVAPLSKKDALQVVLEGRGFEGYGTFTGYDSLSPDHILELIASWSPIIRLRAGSAYARKPDAPLEPLLKMLEDPSLDARLGACEALSFMKNKAIPAIPKLRELLKADQIWLRIKAAEALNGIGSPAMVAVPEMLKMAAKGSSAKDPRAMEQRYMVQLMFSTRDGILGKSLAGVDRELIYQVLRSAAHNEDGRTRGALGSIYSNLTYDELKPVMPVIQQAIIEKSPSGEMFDGQIQNAGLDLYSRHHVKEGIQMIADYTRLQKAHGSDSNLPKLLNMLKRYGTHAKLAIPNLEKTIQFLEDPERKDFPLSLGKQMAEVVRQSIREIEQLKDTPELIDLN